MTMTIREAKAGDIKSLIRLWHKLMEYHEKLPSKDPLRSIRKLDPDAEKIWRAYALKWIRSPNGFVLVAEKDGALIGYSMNYIRSNIPIYSIKLFGNMGDLFIEPAYRGKGMASAFRKMAWEWFRKKKMGFVRIAVHPKNPKSKTIYSGWGFEENHIEMIKKI